MQLTDVQKDALTEVVNIGVGKAAAALSQLIGDRIHLSIPKITVCGANELNRILESKREQLDMSVVQDFRGDVSGRALLAFPRASGVKLGQVVAGLEEVGDELDLGLVDVLDEVGNIVLSGVLGSIGNLLDTGLAYSVPRLHPNTDIRQLLADRPMDERSTDSARMIANTLFDVASRSINGTLLIVFNLGGIETIIDAALGQATSAH